jgi:hypothetical protein
MKSTGSYFSHPTTGNARERSEFGARDAFEAPD